MALKVLNLLGGPGLGKSTAAAGIFYFMKMKGYKVELVREYIKNPVYEGRKLFDDQVYIFGKQNRLQHILRNECDWIVTDSPLLLSAVYAPKNYFASFSKIVMEAYNSYDNYNFLLTREKEYVNLGRVQTKEEAIEIDKKIKLFMEQAHIPYISVKGDMETVPHDIMEVLVL